MSAELFGYPEKSAWMDGKLQRGGDYNRSDSGICFGNPCGTWTEGEVEAGASSDHPDDGNPIFQLYVCRNFHGASGHRVSGRIGDT